MNDEADAARVVEHLAAQVAQLSKERAILLARLEAALEAQSASSLAQGMAEMNREVTECTGEWQVPVPIE